MRLTILLAFLLAGSASLAQSSLLYTDTLWLHKADPTQEDLDSYFPIIRSQLPAIPVQRINTALQMLMLGYVLTDKKKTEVVNGPFDILNVLGFSMDRLSPRVIAVTITRHQTNNAMSLNGWEDTWTFYFDVATGGEIHFREFFSDSGFKTLVKQATGQMHKSMYGIMAHAQDTPDFGAADEQKLEADCQCGCMAHINDSFCIDNVRMSSAPAGYSFSTPDCDWMLPRQHDMYVAQFTREQLVPLLSDYGTYMLTMTGPPVPYRSLYYRVWKGMIGGKIPITFMIRPGCDPTGISGTEIYDNYGATIQLGGSVVNQLFRIDELDAGNKAVAVIEATFKSGKLVGFWKKSDGSKTFGFEASPQVP